MYSIIKKEAPKGSGTRIRNKINAYSQLMEQGNA